MILSQFFHNLYATVGYINQLSFTPETDLIELMVDGVNAEIDLLKGIGVEFEL